MNVQILHGNCVDLMAAMEPESIHACVTSPPYWGLRDYGTAPLEWPAFAYSPMPGLPACVEIPAMKSSLGLEPTLEAFIGHMVLVFRGVHRVLRDDATAWVNMGDCYATGAGKVNTAPGGGTQGERWKGIRGTDKQAAMGPVTQPNRMPQSGLKPKDLAGQPWRLAFALQADGWWLRQDVIWNKPAPMPESTKDRCTKAHEYLFLLAKSARYYWDVEAMQEPALTAAEAHWAGTENGLESSVSHAGSGKSTRRFRSTKPVSGWDTGPGAHDQMVGRYPANVLNEKDAGRSEGPITRNKRTVWTVNTEPFKEAHFATFPPALIKPCIEASCPIGGTVLDPFGGAGTTGLVADRLGRNAVLCELNPNYIAIGERRIAGDQGHVARQIALGEIMSLGTAR